jgi:hypothetical protein
MKNLIEKKLFTTINDFPRTKKSPYNFPSGFSRVTCSE